MDIVPRSKSLSPAASGYRDENAALARDLAPIAQITGKEVAPRSMKGDYLGIEVDRSNLVAVCRFLRDQLGFDMLSCISGVDMLDHLETVYHLRSLTRKQLLQIKVRLDHEKPEVDSVVSVWPTANWLERETYDMFGIRFAGHPDLRRMLLDDDFEGYPLLKSFHQVPHDRQTPGYHASRSQSSRCGTIPAKRRGTRGAEESGAGSGRTPASWHAYLRPRLRGVRGRAAQRCHH